MAAGFEYFDNTSAGAPVLTGSAGKLAAVMDWFLTGKGGWDTAYTGTNLRAYRPQTGNRFYLRVDDTQSVYSRLRAYRAMTAISTGTNQFPNSTQAVNINTWGCRKAYAASTTIPQRYWGIRTNQWFVLVIECSRVEDAGVMYRQMIAFGDVPSLCEADSHNTLLVGVPSLDTVYYYTLYEQTWDNLKPSINYNYPAWAAMSGTPNGAIASPLCGVHAPFRGAAASQKGALVLSDRLHFGPLVVGCTNSTSTGGNGAFPRARFPNVSHLYGPCGDAPDAQYPCVDLVPFTVGARTFLPLLSYTNGANGYQVDTWLLEKTDTDGAL